MKALDSRVEEAFALLEMYADVAFHVLLNLLLTLKHPVMVRLVVEEVVWRLFETSALVDLRRWISARQLSS